MKRLKAQRLFTASMVVLYPLWGLISSAMLFGILPIRSRLLCSLLAILLAGLLPLGLYLIEVRCFAQPFEWPMIFASLSIGGVMTLFFGSLLQALLLACGIDSIFGLPLNVWGWRFPEWMFQTP